MTVSSSYFADYQAIVASGLFDVEFYAAQLQGSDSERLDPIVHYLTEGARLGLEPNPGFDSRHYLEQCRRLGEEPDIPLAHFIRVGATQGLTPFPRSPAVEPDDSTADAVGDGFEGLDDEAFRLMAEAFDPDDYARRYGRKIGALSRAELFDHYLRNVRARTVDPSPNFSESAYLAGNPDVAEQVRSGAFHCGFQHYVTFGLREGRLPLDLFSHQRSVIRDAFDGEYYLGQTPELADHVTDPILHYLQFGWREGRDPSPAFSTRFYLDSNPDVRESGINPFVHFVEWGWAEGRLGVPPARDRAQVGAKPPGPAVVDDLETVRAFFDEVYYRNRYRGLVAGAGDLLAHYMEQGWRELKDPSAEFSTSYYLGSNPDIRDAGLNPFLHYVRHGRREGRKPLPFREWVLRRPYRPRVTAIVPNFNHAAFLRQRLDSILNQTYKNVEILIMDDASTDNSVKIITEYKKAHPRKIRALLNSVNSGSVFSQWRKGVENARGELIWICESDDFCTDTFLEHCVGPLADDSVMISFGRVQFADSKGKPTAGLDSYREDAEPGIWSTPVVRPASQWFRGAFAVSNVIPNVGGCLIRNQPISEDVWREALTYRICGDWFLYGALSHGGQIAYTPEAIAYFRQHSGNTSVSGFLQPHYYAEHESIAISLRRRWGAPDAAMERTYENLQRTYRHAKAARKVGSLQKLFRLPRVLSEHRRSSHVLVCFLGFQLGGGELFAIHLANALSAQGYLVSMLKLNSENENEAVKGMLDRRIAVYDAEQAIEIGLEAFIANTGVDLIHSHNVGIEFLFFKRHRFSSPIPYVVTLHGSYEVTPLPEDFLLRALRAVSHWVYLAPKNLAHLKGIPMAADRISHIPNAMPADARPFAFTRAALKIEKEAIVFTLASRAIPEKGWGIAIRALRAAQKSATRPLHLILCGSGPDAEALPKEFATEERVHFMGFQDRINGAYAISDVAILPSRFGGESYPLSLIQAMQEGRPIIATDIGQIRHMLVGGDLCAGVLVASEEDDARFARAVAKAMVRMCDDRFRADRAADAAKLGGEFSMTNVARRYVDIYERYLPEDLRDRGAGAAIEPDPESSVSAPGSD